jgi:capsular polysaccharide transport system permease protein
MKSRTSFAIFKSSVFALFLREMYDSVGIKKIGYFWLFFDILFTVLIFVGLRGYLKGVNIPGLDFIVFLTINLMAFYFFKTTVKLLTNSLSASKNLFDYKQIKPIDVIFSKFLFNFFIRILATFVLMFIGYYFEFDMEVKNFNLVLLSVIWLSIFSLGIGILSAVLATFFDFYKKMYGYMMLPLMFTSAVFYTVESLPTMLRELIVYNPLVHFMEMLHGSYFYVLDTRYVDYMYMTYWTIIPFFIGLFLYTKSEKNIIAS